MSHVDVSGCGFCDAVQGRARSEPRACDDEHFAVFVGRYQPAGPGYALVVPLAHIQDLHALSEQECGSMLQMVRLTSAAIQRAFHVSGTTVLQNNGPPGQSVPHLHFHVVPRHAGDGYPRRSDVPVPDDELTRQSLELAAILGPSGS